MDREVQRFEQKNIAYLEETCSQHFGVGLAPTVNLTSPAFSTDINSSTSNTKSSDVCNIKFSLQNPGQSHQFFKKMC